MGWAVRREIGPQVWRLIARISLPPSSRSNQRSPHSGVIRKYVTAETIFAGFVQFVAKISVGNFGATVGASGNVVASNELI
jgi:hypothetical protein